MRDMKAIKAAIRDVRAGMGTRTAATKHGLTRDVVKYWKQKADAESTRFRNAIAQEKTKNGQA